MKYSGNRGVASVRNANATTLKSWLVANEARQKTSIQVGVASWKPKKVEERSGFVEGAANAWKPYTIGSKRKR